jgi:hypothetical protein
MMTRLLFSLLIAILMLTGCQQQSPMPQQNSVYYWRTEWHLDSVERNFLKQYDIQKVYCRYFDVVMRNDEPMPNATISFAEPVDPSLNIVPTVYITEDCMHSEHKGLAKKIVERIMQMNETNDVKHVKEIQIDCDYTGRSLNTYYQFLEDVRTTASQHDMRLSTTIRLHQLSMEVPPADYGVLMLYNTGNPQKYAERNPILDIRDVMPYISKLDDYALPLAAAYPVFLWQRTIYGVHVDHWVEADEILKVKDVVEEKRPELRRTILTYHLDKENIKRYTPETYETIYHH